MKNVMICTVGTSLKGNLMRETTSPELQGLLEKSNIQALALKLAELAPDDRITGAEINSITSILKKQMLSSRAHLYFLVSDTADGTLIGKILEAYYLRRKNPFCFDNVEVRTIAGLTDRSVHLFRTEGLRNLVRSISEIVRKHGSPSVLINATGGYKAQISFAGMIGQALDIPVCYLFESFSEVITLPPQPVSLDLSFWLENAALFYDLAKDNATDNPGLMDERFSSLVDEIDVDDGKLTGLSPTGQLFHETFQHRFLLAKKDLLPPDSDINPLKKELKYEDKNGGRHHGLEHYIEKLRRVPYVVRIFTHYYNQDLPIKNYFKRSAKGAFTQIEGGYSDGKATTKFDVVTTAENEGQRNAAVADLSGLF